MKPKSEYIILRIILFLILSVSYCSAQETADTLDYRIETNGGNIYIGKILSQDTKKILFSADKLGDITLEKAEIKKIEVVEIQKMKDGKYWFDNPQATRYFFSPNAYGLNRGEGYYQNIWVLVNSFAVGVNDYISLGGGIVPLFFFGGSPTPVWFTPKVSIPIARDKVGLGAGALFATVLGEEGANFGLLYGISTFGSKDNNVSIGLGYGYAGGDWADAPMINLNGMFRLGSSGYIITENYYLRSGGESLIMLSLGGRTIIRKAGLDYGLILPIFNDMDQFFAFPWLGITIPFGNKPGVVL